MSAHLLITDRTYVLSLLQNGRSTDLAQLEGAAQCLLPAALPPPFALLPLLAASASESPPISAAPPPTSIAPQSVIFTSTTTHDFHIMHISTPTMTLRLAGGP